MVIAKHCPKSMLTMTVLLMFTADFCMGALSVYETPEGDSVYTKVASYDVSYADALTAFSAAGGAPYQGLPGEAILNYTDVPGVNFLGLQSWNGFVQFLAEHYGPANALKTEHNCGDRVKFKGYFHWNCAPHENCPSPTNDKCTGKIYSAGYPDYDCYSEDLCPFGQRCEDVYPPFTHVEADAVGTEDEPGCECDFTGYLPECKKSGVPIIVGLATEEGPYCVCKGPTANDILRECAKLVLPYGTGGAMKSCVDDYWHNSCDDSQGSGAYFPRFDLTQGYEGGTEIRLYDGGETVELRVGRYGCVADSLLQGQGNVDSVMFYVLDIDTYDDTTIPFESLPWVRLGAGMFDSASLWRINWQTSLFLDPMGYALRADFYDLTQGQEPLSAMNFAFVRTAAIPAVRGWGMFLFVVLLAGWMAFVVVRRWKASHAAA